MDKDSILKGDFHIFGSIPKEKALVFWVSGAIDFMEQVEIHLSNEPIEGYEEAHPWEIYCVVSKDLHYARSYLTGKFIKILGYMPHISDSRLKPDMKAYYKCVHSYLHSHDHTYKPNIKKLTMNQAKYMIINQKLDLL